MSLLLLLLAGTVKSPGRGGVEWGREEAKAGADGQIRCGNDVGLMAAAAATS